MPLDPTIPLGVTQPDVAGTISKWQQLGIQNSQAETARNQAALSSATLQPNIEGAKAQSQSAISKAALDRLSLIDQHSSGILKTFVPIADKPDLSYDDLVNAAKQQAQILGSPPESLQQVISQIQQGKTPAEYQLLAKQEIAEATGMQHALSLIMGTPSSVSQGGQVQPGMTAGPLSRNAGAFTPAGTAVPNTPPVTAQFWNSKTKQMEMLGNRANPPSAQSGAGIPLGPPMGEQEAVQGGIAPNVKHFADVQAAANAAPMRITQLQEIKSLAPGAVTGDASIKRQVYSKLAGYLGVVFDPESQTKTDEMLKSGALLMERAGATDAAREVAAMATPNYKMTKKAINSVSNALIGMERRNLAASAYFNGVPQNDPEYGQRIQVWNNIPARDKAFMVLSMPVDEKTALANKLRGTPQGKELAAGIRAIEALGLK